jgi:hypothetical protein
VIDLRADFTERVTEVEAFIDLVAAIERSVQNGIPLLSSPTGGATVVKPLQQRLLYAGVYLHLYNLIEATVSRCIAAVEEAASAAHQWRPGDLSTELRAEWVRSVARTHEILSTDLRLEAAIKLCDHLVDMLPVKMKIAQGGGGNWDDEEIFRFANRLGISLKLKSASAVKRPFREDKGALQLIKFLRNKLAHGEMSFAECGDGLSAAQLVDLKERTVNYLSEVIDCFEGFISRYEYLLPAKRPVEGAG